MDYLIGAAGLFLMMALAYLVLMLPGHVEACPDGWTEAHTISIHRGCAPTPETARKFNAHFNEGGRDV